jgi:hypothetical protein
VTEGRSLKSKLKSKKFGKVSNALGLKERSKRGIRRGMSLLMIVSAASVWKEQSQDLYTDWLAILHHMFPLRCLHGTT